MFLSIQILNVLDSFTDGIGLRSIDPRCTQSQMRYGTFRAMVYSHFHDLQQHDPERWTEFVERLREVQPQGFEYFNYVELNTFDIAAL